MDRKFASACLYSAAPPGLQHRPLLLARSVYEAAGGRIRGTSSGGLLLLSLGVWAVVWAALASLAAWLR
jgi:hypothetical protein